MLEYLDAVDSDTDDTSEEEDGASHDTPSTAHLVS
jgi:hypothetical protein